MTTTNIMHPNLSDPPRRFQSVRTLLVDDSPLTLKALSQILAKESGFTVVGSATNGCQALRYTSVLAPELVLMGLRLSKLNGAQATTQIKHSKNPPIVFMVSPDDSPSSRATTEAAGADGLVVKSADLGAQLKSKLQEWFGTRASRPELQQSHVCRKSTSKGPGPRNNRDPKP